MTAYRVVSGWVYRIKFDVAEAGVIVCDYSFAPQGSTVPAGAMVFHPIEYSRSKGIHLVALVIGPKADDSDEMVWGAGQVLPVLNPAYITDYKG